MNDQENSFRERDIMTLRVMGSFFSIMGSLVLIATYKTIGNTPAMVVNICSGLALLAVGLGMIQVSRRMRRRGPGS